MDIKIQFDETELESTLRSFYTITGIRIVVSTISSGRSQRIRRSICPTAVNSGRIRQPGMRAG